MDHPPTPPATLHGLDWAILAVYGVVCIVIGWWAMRQVRDAGGYLLARRKLGKVMSLAATFAGGVNANDPVAVTSKVYAQGASGIWTALNFLLLTPWFWMRDPVGRRLRLVTSIDVLNLRYGPTLGTIGLVLAMIGSVFTLALGIKAAALVTVGVSGGDAAMALLPVTDNTTWNAMFLAAAMVVLPTMLYTVMGGILAACATDVFMSGLIILLSFIAIPFAWSAIGGVDALRAALPPDHLSLFSAGADFSLWGVFWFVILWIFSLPPSPSAAKDEMTARVGSLGLLFKRFCTIGWAALGLFGVVLYGASQGLTPAAGDKIFSMLCVDLLPAGLRGLMVAAILAAAMSTIASLALSFTGMALHNIYRPLVRPAADAAHYLLVARILTVVILCAGWALAVVDQNDIFRFFANLGQFGAMIGVCTLGAYLWRRSTAAGAYASVAVMLLPVAIAFSGAGLAGPWPAVLEPLRVVWVGWLQVLESGYRSLGVESVALVRVAGTITDAPLGIRLPAQLLPGIAALVVGSLLSRQHDTRSVEEFYARLDTPVGDEQQLVARGIKVDMLQDLGSDADVTTRDPSRRLLFLDLLYLPWLLTRGQARISDYRIDLIGIVLSGAFVAAFIGGILALLAWLRGP
ncbi:MAG: hypothetical protein RLZZ127_525 [Planctomycetota bacterium]|jgi:SSS family solute:Na+ symporter